MLGMATAEELKVGDKAPDFTLPGSDGKTYKLSDYQGKQAVVLAWFPKAFTPGCTTECKAFAAGGQKLKRFDAAYFTVSVDRPEKNKEFAASVGADYPILSDHEGKVARAYGVTGAVQKWASRWTFFIGKDGKILYHRQARQTEDPRRRRGRKAQGTRRAREEIAREEMSAHGATSLFPRSAWEHPARTLCVR